MKKTKVKKISKRKQLKNIEKQLPKSYRPITGWGYFFRGILYSIPVLGWIIAWCKAAKAKNRNVSNFARMYGTFAVLLLIAAAVVVGLDLAKVVDLLPMI
jgi:hypothetical protein